MFILTPPSPAGDQIIRAGRKTGRSKVLVEQGAIEMGQHIDGSLIIAAQHNPVRVEGIVHRRPLPQKLRVGGHGKPSIGPVAVGTLIGIPHQAAHPIATANGHRGLVHNHRKALALVCAAQVRPNGLGHLAHKVQIRAAIRIGRRTHGDKDHLCPVQAGGHIVADEVDAPIGLGQQVGQSRFVDGQFALIQLFDLGRIHIQAGHLMAQIGQGDAGGKADVAGAYNYYIHRTWSHVGSNWLDSFDERLNGVRMSLM